MVGDSGSWDAGRAELRRVRMEMLAAFLLLLSPLAFLHVLPLTLLIIYSNLCIAVGSGSFLSLVSIHRIVRERIPLGLDKFPIFSGADKLRLIFPWWLIAGGIAVVAAGSGALYSSQMLRQLGYDPAQLGYNDAFAAGLVVCGVAGFLVGAYLNHLNAPSVRRLLDVP